MVDALVTIVKEEGVLGLYKGVVPALFLTSHGAVQFAAYEWLKRFFANIRANSKRGSTTEMMLQPAAVSMFTGAAAKILASTMTYPYQVIRSRLQQRDGANGSSTAVSSSSSSSGSGSGGGSGSSSSSSSSTHSSSGSSGIRSSGGAISSEPKYTGTLDCAVKIWRNEGVSGFFRGVIPNAIKVAPAAALTFVVYEECLKFLISGPDPDTVTG
jgi:solute carrier family 25 folate transporter 32